MDSLNVVGDEATRLGEQSSSWIHIMGACCSLERDFCLHPQTCGKNRTDNGPGNSWSIFRGLHKPQLSWSPAYHQWRKPANSRTQTPSIVWLPCQPLASVCGWYSGCWDGAARTTASHSPTTTTGKLPAVPGSALSGSKGCGGSFTMVDVLQYSSEV